MSTGVVSSAKTAVPGQRPTGQPRGKKAAQEDRPRVLRVGAVPYNPESVTMWRGIRYYFRRQGQPLEYVLFSNYDALVEALHDGQVDIAWNSPLAHARYHLLAGGRSQTLAMRDVDCNYRCQLVVRKDAGVNSLADLAGKTVIFGSCDAAEATVLPVYFLKKEGLPLDKINILSLHDEMDQRGTPCCSEHHVLEALKQSRGQAGILSEQLWKQLSTQKPAEIAPFKVLWTSPPFSHCVFTAQHDFDKELGARFTKLMLAMDNKEPLTAEILKLEMASKWVTGSPEGFEHLLRALRETDAVPLGKN